MTEETSAVATGPEPEDPPTPSPGEPDSGPVAAADDSPGAPDDRPIDNPGESARAASETLPPAAPVKRPRGRPRKDGLPPGSPEAKAADAPRERPSLPAETTAEQSEPPPVPAESAPEAPAAPKVAEAPPRPRRQRAAAQAAKPQSPDKPHCEDPHCTAIHPSRGGKAGRTCVETGKAIVAPMQMAEGERVVSGVLRGFGFLIALFGGVPSVSPPSEMELAIATPPTIRMLHRMGIGEGNMWLDGFMIAIALGMYSSARVAEINEAKARAKRLAA